jgi:hypothetical protein
MYFKGDKISKYDFLRREVKPTASSPSILRQVKEPSGVFRQKNSLPFLAKFPLICYKVSLLYMPE